MTVYEKLSGSIVATGVTLDEYMDKYAAEGCEWVGGIVYKMSPVRLDHDNLTAYLRTLFDTYFAYRPIGEAKGTDFVMRVEATESAREPDMQIILKDNPGTLTETGMIGAADICIEVVSPESEERDYGTKLGEYERGGVGEYWIFDRIRQGAQFYRLNEAGTYIAQSVDERGIYRTPKLPGFELHVPTLWQEQLPTPPTIVEAVKKMLGDA
jgi:Uma2 family endonuclease